MKKRILTLCLLTVFLIFVSGCNSNNNNEEEKTPVMPDWANTAVIYEVNVRQYTAEGTFTAFSAHLDRLKELGINTLWFMPIHPISAVKRLGTLGSYYSIADYYGVNPEFGTKDDFKELVDTCHNKGFKVMMDWVANHTGWDNPWITEHKDWYYQDADGNIRYPQTWQDVAWLKYTDNKSLRLEMIKAMKYWVDDFDIDGFRCDYAVGVPADFWEAARIGISKSKDIYMLAEADPRAALLKTAFDSYYNWPLFRLLKDIAKGSAKANALERFIPVTNTNVPEGKFPLNFIDNHDENSWNGTLAESFGADAIPAFTALLFTMPGAPLVYSGQEAGLDKRLEFFEKDEIHWDAFPYQELISRLSAIKTTNPALYNISGSGSGEYRFIAAENDHIAAFESVSGGNKITAIINLSNEEQEEPNNSWGINGGGSVLIHGDAETTVKTGETGINFGQTGALSVFSPWEYYVISSP